MRGKRKESGWKEARWVWTTNNNAFLFPILIIKLFPKKKWIKFYSVSQTTREKE